jgi:hypothetical protein
VAFLIHGNKFLAEEFDVVQGRTVWASLEGRGTLGPGPRRCLGSNRGTTAEGVKEVGSWVVQVPDMGVEITSIGTAPIHKLLPTRTRLQACSSVGY